MNLDEVKDVHPIFRANPFLIEPGLKLIKGEKYVSDSDLSHIDLLFTDIHKVLTFVEVKWSGVNENQMIKYSQLIKQKHPDSRIIWAVPDDFSQKIGVLPVTKYGIEIKLFDRRKIFAINTLQNASDILLNKIRYILSTPMPVKIHGESIQFENPILACYFEGRIITDRGSAKKVGMKQQSIGRQLDLMKNLLSGHLAEVHREKVPLLIWQILKAPYMIKSGKSWKIFDGGLIERIEGYYDSDLEKLIKQIWVDINAFYSNYSWQLKDIFDNDVKKYDIITMLLYDLAEEKGMDIFSIPEIISWFIEKMEIKHAVPPVKIRHGILNQWIDNIAIGNLGNYDNDLAKRLVELATLRRILMLKMGTVDMWTLVPSTRNGKLLADREPCQMLKLNPDTNLYISIDQYSEEAEK